MTKEEALKAENERLKRQLARAGLFDPKRVPEPARKAPGFLWAQCAWASCRHLARYPRNPGTRLARRPCAKCGLPLGHGANLRALRTISKRKPRSSIARILDNLELGWRTAKQGRSAGT